MINAERIAEMKRLSAEASVGKWEIDRNSDDNDFVTDIWVGGDDSGHIEIHGDTVASSINNAQFIAKSRQFVPDIIAAYEETKLSAEAYELMVRGLNVMVAERDAEIEKLRKALEYYSDDIHYDPYFFEGATCDVTEDGGHIAKEALVNGE